MYEIKLGLVRIYPVRNYLLGAPAAPPYLTSEDSETSSARAAPTAKVLRLHTLGGQI